MAIRSRTQALATVDCPERLTPMLRQALADRRIGDGIALLQGSRPLLAEAAPSGARAALVGLVAQWVDIGFDGPELVERLLEGFAVADHATMPLSGYAYLRLARGMVLMAREASDEAIAHFDFVIGLDPDFSDRQSLAIVHFWKARCLRKKGEYDEAMTCTAKARDLAQEVGSPRMAAVMRVLESWLLFQKAKPTEARRLLREAESVLGATDDHVTLGNIQSSYGRIASREGRFDESLEHFADAIEQYKRRDAQHRNLARTLANMAQVERLIARQMTRRIDADVERRRRSGSGGPRQADHRAGDRARMEQLRTQALAHLDEAAAIYRHHPNRHGTGSVHLGYGYLSLDGGDYERAEAEAALAFRLGEDKRDAILMARARLLECMVENARADEEIGETAETGRHARQADMFAREAIELAGRTQDRRLLASAHMWKGLIDLNPFFDNADAARQAYDRAAAYLKGDHTSDIWDDMRALKQRLLGRGTIDATLRAWSQGSLGDKTFQQISEEFAELVIPKVWEREGRRVSRVAARLSISPKKVRRILRRTGRLKR